MPYISEEMRGRTHDHPNIRANEHSLDTRIEELLDTINRLFHNEELGGVINYCFSRILADCYDFDSNPRYHKLERAIGNVECIKLEIYRRIGAVYEDRAIKKNGDIPEYDIFEQLMA